MTELLNLLFPEVARMSPAELALFCGSQAFGIGTFVLCILQGQTNRFRRILGLKIAANLMQALSCLLVAAYSGAAVAALATVISAAAFWIRRDGKQVPWWFTAASLVAYCGSGLLSYASPKDLLPVIGGILFVLSIVAKNPTAFRVIVLISGLVWLPYDISSLVYANLLIHGGNVIAFSVGILRFDILKQHKKEA